MERKLNDVADRHPKYGETVMKDVVVKHPRYGETTVRGVPRNLEAAMEAARRWGAQWSVIARESTFGVPGGPTGPLGRGGAAERTSPRACAGASDTELATPKGGAG